MKKEEVIWFTGGHGTTGIVLYENEVGEKKAYIGAGGGFSEEADMKQIKNHGAKLTLDKAEQIVEHLKS